MNPLRKSFLVAATVGSLFTAAVSPVWAGTTDYQVTGTISAMTDTSITVLKGGKESFEMAKDATTKSTGEMKVGDKVTAHYTLTAISVEAKAAPAAKPAKAPKAAKAAASPAPMTKPAPAGTTEVQKPAAEAGSAASPAATPGQ